MSFGGLNNSMLLDWGLFFYCPAWFNGKSRDIYQYKKKKISYLGGNTYSHEIWDPQPNMFQISTKTLYQFVNVFKVQNTGHIKYDINWRRSSIFVVDCKYVQCINLAISLFTLNM